MSDLIERQKALDGLKYEMKYGAEMDSYGLDTAYDIIENIPSAESEQKKGKWIKHENPTLGHCMKIFYECSVCHKAVGCEYFVRRSFCPSCDADMRGDQ